jgi:hypothetical protein
MEDEHPMKIKANGMPQTACVIVEKMNQRLQNRQISLPSNSSMRKAEQLWWD